MLAVSAHADGKGSCPLELAEALWSERYHLAGPGALDDQDAVQLIRYDQLRAIYQACLHFRQNGLKGMAVDERNIILEIADLELANA